MVAGVKTKVTDGVVMITGITKTLGLGFRVGVEGL